MGSNPTSATKYASCRAVKGDGLQNHSEKFVGSNPTLRAIYVCRPTVKTFASKTDYEGSSPSRRANINLIRKEIIFKTRNAPKWLRIQNRKKRWWWKIVHYNYFHKKLFKEYYVQKKSFTEKQIRKYQLYIKLDNLITLRWCKLWFKIQNYLER